MDMIVVPSELLVAKIKRIIQICFASHEQAIHTYRDAWREQIEEEKRQRDIERRWQRFEETKEDGDILEKGLTKCLLMNIVLI